MALLNDLLEVSSANRVFDLERLGAEQVVKGDFEGSVAGKWVRLDENGAGVVQYNSRLYVTKPIGFTSVPAGTTVEMTFANGIYYSKW